MNRSLRFALAGAAAGAALASVRQWNRPVASRYLSADVLIERDRLGVPVISAESRDDALFALGCCVAADRLWQMDTLRRMALGRLSEIAGSEALPFDRLMRLLGMPAIVERLASSASGDARRALEAFAAGVNQRVATGPLPVEFRFLGYRPEPWRPADSIALVRLMGWMMAGMHLTDIVADRLGEIVGYNWLDAILLGSTPTTPPPVSSRNHRAADDGSSGLSSGGCESFGGSNAWAVAGSRSISGAPILASDPHLTYSTPSIWYEADIRAPGFEVRGMTIPGLPGIGIGRTPTFAWAFTASMISQTFTYRERLNAAGTHVEDVDGWTPLTIRTERIRVKGEPDVTLAVRSTPRGPLISDLEPELCAGAVSLHWTGMEPGDDIDAILRLNAARSIDDALDARELAPVPPFNLIAADSGGSITLTTIGRSPRRSPRAGLQEPHEYPPEYVPLDQAALVRDPAEGFVANANNALDFDRDGDRDQIRGNWEPRFRVDRIRSVLSSRDRHSPAELRQLQLDTYSDHALKTAALLLRRLGSDAPGWVVDDLTTWDGRVLADSRAALVVEVFYDRWARLVRGYRLAPDLSSAMALHVAGGAQFRFYDRLLRGELSAWFDGADADSQVRRAFAEGLLWIEQHLGSDRRHWTWGRLHTLTFTHPFGLRSGPHQLLVNVGPIPVGGDRSTVWMTFWDPDIPFVVRGGPSMRLVTDLAPSGRTWLTNTLGQAENPLSRHYHDQTADLLSGHMHPSPAGSLRAWRVLRAGESGPPAGRALDNRGD